MSANHAKTLLDNSSIAAGSTASGTGWVPWIGGRSQLIVWLGSGGQLPGTLKLQKLASDESTAIDVASIAAVGLSNYDLSPGKYRMYQDGSGTTGSKVTAHLALVPYSRN